MKCWYDDNINCLEDCELVADCQDRARMLDIREECINKALQPIAKVIDDFCRGDILNSIMALQMINEIICENTKWEKEKSNDLSKLDS